MKVIFLKEVANVADKDTVKAVSDGYARNFLFPHRFAVPASEGALKALGSRVAEKTKKEEQEKASLKEIASKVDGLEIEIPADVGENGKLFGSVTSSDIAKKLHETHGVDIDKKKIQLSEPIKATGIFDIPVKFASDIHATIKVSVSASPKA